MKTSRYINIGPRKLHFHIMGSGPAIVLFHPSPLTSEMLFPIAEALKETYTVICLDTPGYGKSDGFDTPPKTIEAYTSLLHQLFSKLKLNKPSLYGNATGAQIAIRYAINYPNNVASVFLDNAAHFDDDLRDEIMVNYFPNLTPMEDGSHLKTIWDIVSNMFQYFPWCYQTPEYALNKKKPPKEVLHSIAMDYVKAGKSYYYAYKTAFKHELASNVQQIQIPTTIFNWKGSIIAPYIDALVSHEFPKNIEVIDIEEELSVRMDTMISTILSKATGLKYTLPDNVITEISEIETLNIPEVIPPKITNDGRHLTEAWEALKQFQPNLSIEQQQQCLIHWYSV